MKKSNQFITISFLKALVILQTFSTIASLSLITTFNKIILCLRWKNYHLKELRNRILRIILVWSLFYLIRVYLGLHFLKFILEN